MGPCIKYVAFWGGGGPAIVVTLFNVQGGEGGKKWSKTCNVLCTRSPMESLCQKSSKHLDAVLVLPPSLGHFSQE